MIQVQKFVFSPFQENTIVLFDETKECVIIDPGCFDQNERDELKGFIESNGLKPVQLLNTHCHLDHVFGNQFVANEFGIELAIHEKDLPTLEWVPRACEMYGIPGYMESPQPSSFLDEGDQVKFGNSTLDIRFVPGHAPGHIVFIANEEGFVINADCLFAGSIGRTDLPGGDHPTLIASIKEKLFTLPDDYVVYTGHGPETTIGAEKSGNPFF